MNAKELRIGNYINQSLVGNGWSLGRINFAKDLALVEDYPSNFNPIPLTEEWLLKFGFKYFNQYEIGKGWKNKDIIIRLINGNFCMIYGIGIYSNVCSVNKLQNLYFAITSEELTKNQ